MINIDTSNIKKYATPVTIGAFFLMAITGILMFFHADIALNKLAHEWLGWAFVIGGLLHLFSHYRSFFKYLQNPKSVVIMGVFIAILIGSFLPLKKESANPMRTVMKAVSTTPIDALFPLTQKSPEEILSNLAAQGFQVQDPHRDTVETISGGDREKNKEIIAIIFGNEKSGSGEKKEFRKDGDKNFGGRPPMPQMHDGRPEGEFRGEQNGDKPMPPREGFEGRDNFKSNK